MTRKSPPSNFVALPETDLDAVCGGFDFDACVSHVMMASEGGATAGLVAGSWLGGPPGFVAGGIAGGVGGAAATLWLDPACNAAPSDAGAGTTGGAASEDYTGAYGGYGGY